MNQAHEYVSWYADDRGNVKCALIDALEVESDQDWHAGTTTWQFDDSSAIRIEGNEVSVFGEMPNTNEDGWYFVGYLK